MARRCELTGKSPMVGNHVSHANNKTKRRFLPNLTEVSLTSETLGQTRRFRISAAALRTVDHRGGLDAFLAEGPRRGALGEGLEAQARDREGAAHRLSAAIRATARKTSSNVPGGDLGPRVFVGLRLLPFRALVARQDRQGGEHR